VPEEVLRALYQTPTCDIHSFCQQRGHESLYFVVDPGRDSTALARLYQLGLPFEPMPLLIGTDLAALAAQGPFGFSAQTHSELSRAAARLCSANHCGIVFAGAERDALQNHARSLLKVNDGSGGQSMLSLGNPHLWAALALTSETAAQRLFGPCSEVFSPVPHQLSMAPAPWYHWPAPPSRSLDPKAPLLALPPGFVHTAQTLQILYWVDERYQVLGSPSLEQLPRLLGNFAALIKHGITEGRHLLKLATMAKGPDLTENAEAMSILQAHDDDFLKVEQLIHLAANHGQ